ncbi:hypothetical protein SAMN05661091_1930 [Paenibacillus uliginis N3/975]|uniref:Uncharacterized protein n=1 Tax=Paenibacillus uliginis N3/975 TaxID=1313296 RepID=A0A1X7H8N2_9BACL|nr:hypothetical protein SAMN05661091_1930 [Paenibacillus uliginis N3/975]
MLNKVVPKNKSRSSEDSFLGGLLRFMAQDVYDLNK